MSRLIVLALAAVPLVLAGPTVTPAAAADKPPCVAPVAATPVATWSTEARCAIVPAAAGAENFGNKFPGEAAVYMGIVHAAIFDAAAAIEGGYRAYATDGLRAPANTSPEAAIATAAHRTLVGLYGPSGLNPAQQPILDGDYAAYLAAIPDRQAKTNGITLGEQVAAAVLAKRTNDGRDANPTPGDLGQPAAGPGVWDPGSAPALGLRMPGIRPLALESGSQFRPDGPNPLTSSEYAQDFQQAKDLGRSDSTARNQEQTTQALFWTDHDLRQWNDGMLRLAAARKLGLVETARMLAIAHIAGGDAMIGCFDAKYHYWFWRPHQAIARADTDGNPFTEAAPDWRPLRPTPNFPEYPSAHACHSTALAEALATFFGTDRVAVSLDSRVTGTSEEYDRLHEVVKDVNRARVLAGFHFLNSDQEGSTLGRNISRYVVAKLARPTFEVVVGRQSARKISKRRSLAIGLLAREKTTALHARLTRGTRLVATGRLASINGKGTIKLRLRGKKLTAGAYTLQLTGRTAAGQVASGRVKVRIRP